MPRSLTLQGCFARFPSAKPNIQTTTKSAGLAFKGDTLASCPARGARACSGKTAASFNDDPKVALGGFGSSRCALGRLQLVHCRGLCARRWGRWCWECRVWTPGGPAKNLKMKMEEKVNKRKSGKSWKSRFWESQVAFCARGGSIYLQCYFICSESGKTLVHMARFRYLRYDTFPPFLGTTNLGSTCAHNRAQSPSD